jgi:hypothetical protein
MMRKAPRLWTLHTLFDYVNNGGVSVGTKTGEWYPARPEGYHSLKSRIKLAWKVFTGKADAITWPVGQ